MQGLSPQGTRNGFSPPMDLLPNTFDRADIASPRRIPSRNAAKMPDVVRDHRERMAA